MTAVRSEEELELLERFAPLRLVNGFVALDLVFGCLRCSFCFNRQSFPSQPAKPHAHAIESERLAALLASLPAIRAGAVLKLGHDADHSLFEEASLRVLERMGAGVPGGVALFRRLPWRTGAIADWERLPMPLVQVLTLTPASRLLDWPEGAAERLLHAPRPGLPTFFEVRPIAADAVDAAGALIDQLPAGAVLDVCGLLETSGGASVRFDAARSAPPAAIAALRRRALARGLRLHCAVNCQLRGPAGLASHWRRKYAADPQLARSCDGCASAERCRTPVALAQVEALLREGREVLGLRSLELVALDEHGVQLRSSEPVARGDQLWLRARLGAGVEFPEVVGGLLDRVAAPIAARWEEARYFPVAEVLGFARAMQASLT